MKLLFDQNVSFRVIRKIIQSFPEARQVRELQLENASDNQIWQYAKEHNYTIISFDSDFMDLSTLKGFPPKIIWLRMGNSSTEFIAERLIHEAPAILEFLSNQEMAFLELD